jgi:hypothetical protein
MTQTKTEIKAEAIGRVSGEPELAWTMGGVPVCRFAVATEVGPATRSVVKNVYVVGGKASRPSEELAVRCMKLMLGDLVIVPGVERQRLRRTRGVDWVESAIEASNVRLRQRASQTGSGA